MKALKGIRLKKKNLEAYTADITEKARSGSIDPILGRDSEIRQVVQILSRRLKNNPVVVGEPGVGKTAIIEGASLRESPMAPYRIRSKTIVYLPWT